MKEIIVITGASSGFGALAARALARVREFCGSHPIESDMRNGQFFRKESTMTQLEQVMYTATAHTTRGRDAASRSDRRSFLATLAAAGAFGLVLLAAPCYAQTVPVADAQASVISPLPAKLGAPAEDKAIRPFRINVPEEALVDLRRRIAATRWPDRETVTYYDKFAAWTYSGGEPERSLTRDEMLDNISLYWLTNTGTSSSESYWEVWGMSPFNAVDISIPVTVTVFPGEIYRAPRSWGEVIITSSFIGTRSTRAVTSRRSNSRNSSRPSSARRLDHCASWSEGAARTTCAPSSTVTCGSTDLDPIGER